MYPIEKYDIKQYDKTNKDGSTSKVVIAISTYAGKVVKGVAKCQAGDSYNFEDGKNLAAARCDLKVCLKRKDRAFKKKHEIALKMEELQKHYDAACAYYNDALSEVLEASNRLHKIEEKLD